MENNNIQPEKSNTKKKFVIIAGIIVVAVIAILLVLLLNKEPKTSSSKNSNTSTNTNTSSNTNTNTNENKKEPVIDADYVSVQYKNEHGLSYINDIAVKGEQIKVPFITFDTSDADKVNKEIKDLYTEYESRIKESTKCMETEEDIPCGIHSIGYKTYTTDDILSIVVLMASSATSVPIPDYLVYSFDSKTGKLLTLEDLLTKKGMTKEQLIQSSLESIKQFAMSEDYKDSGMLEKMTEIENFIRKNIDLNQTKITAESGVAYFIGDTKGFNIITTLYSDWENESFVQILYLQ